MSKRKLKASCLILIISAIMIVAGCGGGGGGGGSSSSGSSGSGTGTGTGTGLSVTEEVSVVEAQSSTSKIRAMKLAGIFLAPGDMPADSDYNNDRQEIYVHERSAEAFSMINEILCAMAQSKYDEMVNLGNYKAQIDMNQCSQDKDSASSAGADSQNQSSGSTAPDYEMWTLNSSRADNDSPHIVKVWIHEEANGDMPASIIYVKVTITEGTSDTNPYGMFSIYFEGHEVGTGGAVSANIMFKGFLRTEEDAGTGDVLLNFVEQDGDNGSPYVRKVVLNRTPDGSSGSGSIYANSQWDGEKGFDIAFDTLHFLRDDGTTSMCFDRTSFEETAWDYGLYDSNGARVNRNSGFSIKTGEYYGWIGYYGLWLPEEAQVDDGDTVYRVTYGQGGETQTPYTVVKKGGRLKKHTRNTTTLGTVKNIPLDYWDSGSNSRVKWDGTNFVKFAQMNDQSHMWENIAESNLDLSALSFGELNFWSQSLGGQVRVKLANCLWNMETGKVACDSPTNSTQVIYFKEDVVFPGDTVPANLRCYDNCPKYTAEAGGVVPLDPTYAPDYDPWDGTDSYDYTFSSLSSDMLLKENGNALVLVDDQSGQNQYGVMSGPLFEPTEENNALLACDDWNQNGQADEGTCGWKAHSELSVFYTWETGANSWNQFTALKDGEGNVLEFQPPLQIQYTHEQTDETASDYKYNGVNFYLEYSGFGNLHGIPGTCIDMDNGQPVDCGPGTRWVPEFSISDGSAASDGTNDYLIKGLRKEQRMTSVATGECSSLSVVAYTLPSMDDWVAPNIGSEPVVTNAPAVIGGVVQ
ncbi:MAG: hypothetical protein AB1499_05760 [Nitrospirota bacterium]